MVMKTIFITCFTGLITRNILSTDAFDLLRVHPDLRIVIIAPESRAAILRREYGVPSVSVAAVAAVPLVSITKLWWVLATNLLATGTATTQMDGADVHGLGKVIGQAQVIQHFTAFL